MFFRKDIFNAKPASLEAEIDHETTEEDEVKSLPSDTRPVYIIGDNALTCYLAAKITDAGHNVIVIAGKGNNVSLSTNGISLKEDSSLKLSRYKFTTSFWIKEEPKLVIITADAGHINSSLAAVSKTKIGGAPVLCFTPLKDINYLEAVVDGNLFRVFVRCPRRFKAERSERAQIQLFRKFLFFGVAVHMRLGKSEMVKFFP